MSLNFEEVNILGNIINDTFGKGSTNYERENRWYTPPTPGNDSSVVTKGTLSGDILTVTSLVVVSLQESADVTISCTVYTIESACDVFSGKVMVGSESFGLIIETLVFGITVHCQVTSFCELFVGV